MKEQKICLPIYKVAYSICFVILLSLIRGISSVDSIGIAIVPSMALLAIVFCSDTYWIEYREKRWELFKIYSIRKRTQMIFHRLSIQGIYLCVLSLLGYWCFFWQKPFYNTESSIVFIYIPFVMATILSMAFWSVLSMTLVNCFQNIWAGIGISVILWSSLYSAAGKKLLGKWNVFSYVFKDEDQFSWLCGQGVEVLLILLMLFICPIIIKKRG
ncbi:ABC transporter permease [Anaerosporobacter sp.]